MNFSTWTPGAVLLVIVIGVPILCSCIAGLAVAIISARKGNAAAAQAAIEGMRGIAAEQAQSVIKNSGLLDQVGRIQNQVHNMALATPTAVPAQPSVQVIEVIPPTQEPRQS